MNQHAKGLLSLFWRMLLFVPVGLIGLLALALVLGLTVLPPIYSIIVLIEGRYLLGALSLMLWAVWLLFGNRVRCLVFEGFRHGSL